MSGASKSAERAAIDCSPEGVRIHDMNGGWRVIIAKHGDDHATWYYHVNDDARIAVALQREAHRRFGIWKAKATLAPLSAPEGGASNG